MKRFQPGDKAETVDDVLRGIVVAIAGDRITIETEDGFPMEFASSELLTVYGQDRINPTRSEIESAKSEKTSRKRKSSTTISKKRKLPFMEVDLHAEKLSFLPKNHSSGELLDYQLREAKGQLEFAIRKNIPRMVFIHGVGEGILKAELHAMFRKYPNLQYYDASYREYGMGATEVLTRTTD